MNPENAKEIVASYVTGSRVSREQLRLAWETLSSDTEYVDHLQDELGLGADWVSECEVVVSRLAELAELSEEERTQQFPTFEAHLGACAPCRRLFREIAQMRVLSQVSPLERRIEPRDVWLQQPVSRMAPSKGSTRLAERLCAWIDEQGAVLAAGLEWLMQRPVYVRMGAAPMDETGGKRREKAWTIPMSDLDCDLIFRVRPSAQVQSWEFECTCSGAQAKEVAAKARIKLYMEGNPPLFTGRFQTLMIEPLQLEAGVWRLLFTVDDLTREVEISLGSDPSTYMQDSEN